MLAKPLAYMFISVYVSVGYFPDTCWLSCVNVHGCLIWLKNLGRQFQVWWVKRVLLISHHLSIKCILQYKQLLSLHPNFYWLFQIFLFEGDLGTWHKDWVCRLWPGSLNPERVWIWNGLSKAAYIWPSPLPLAMAALYTGQHLAKFGPGCQPAPNSDPFIKQAELGVTFPTLL